MGQSSSSSALAHFCEFVEGRRLHESLLSTGFFQQEASLSSARTHRQCLNWRSGTVSLFLSMCLTIRCCCKPVRRCNSVKFSFTATQIATNGARRALQTSILRSHLTQSSLLLPSTSTYSRASCRGSAKSSAPSASPDACTAANIGAKMVCACAPCANTDYHESAQCAHANNHECAQSVPRTAC